MARFEWPTPQSLLWMLFLVIFSHETNVVLQDSRLTWLGWTTVVCQRLLYSKHRSASLGRPRFQHYISNPVSGLILEPWLAQFITKDDPFPPRQCLAFGKVSHPLEQLSLPCKPMAGPSKCFGAQTIGWFSGFLPRTWEASSGPMATQSSQSPSNSHGAFCLFSFIFEVTCESFGVPCHWRLRL